MRLLKYFCFLCLLGACITPIYSQDCDTILETFDKTSQEAYNFYDSIRQHKDPRVFRIITTFDSLFVHLSPCLPDLSQSLAHKYYEAAIRVADLGDYPRTIEWLKISALLMEELEPAQIDINSLANTYRNIATIYQSSNIVSSEFYYQKAQRVLEANKSPSKAAALLYEEWSNLKEAIGELGQAIEYAEAAYKAADNAKDCIDIAIRVKIRLGILNNILGHHKTAINHLKKSISISLQQNDVTDPDAYLNLGNAYLGLMNLDTALYYYKLAEEVYLSQESKERSFIRLFASLLNNIAVIYIRKARLDKKVSNNQELNSNLLKAQQYLNKAKNMNEGVGLNDGLARNYDNLGDIFQIKGDYVTAQRNYERAVVYALPGWKPDCKECISYEALTFMKVSSQDLFTFLGSKARVTFLQYQEKRIPSLLKTSLKTYRDAFEIINIMRNRVQTRNSRLFWIEEGTPIFEGAIKAALAAKDTVQAFQWSERARAALLYMSMQERELMDQILTEDIRNQDKDLVSQILFNERIYNDNQEPEIAQKLIQLRSERDKLLRKIKESYPTYFQLKYDSDVVHPDSLRRILPSNSCMLEYFMGQEEMYIFKLDSNNLRVYVSSTIEPSLLYTYRELMQKKETPKEEFQNLSIELSKNIIHPLIKDQALPQRLIIVPHGELGFIPFETLAYRSVDVPTAWNSFPFLIKSHVISYSWSATIWKKNQQPLLAKSLKGGLIYAPKFGDLSSGLTELKHNKAEAEEISKILGSEPVVGIRASVDHFKKEAPKYRFIHLATHGGTDPKNSLNNYIAFNTKGIADTTTYLLYMSELYGMQLAADMVVLSACETGYGSLFEGEGIASMARAFAFAGVRSTVMSFWKVDKNQVTANSIVSFYKNLATGMNKDEALQKIKIEMISHGELPHHWAPFVIQGNIDPLDLNRSTSTWQLLLWILLVLSISGITFALFRRK